MNESVPYLAEPAWVSAVLEHADEALLSNPPDYPPSIERQEALMILDGPLHLVAANRYRSVHEFLVRRLEKTIEEIETTSVKTGLMVWRIYGSGFVIRSATRTIGTDIVRGWVLRDGSPEWYGIPKDLAARLVKQLDVLTVSHEHTDHIDPLVRDLAFEQGIPVIVPPGVFEESSSNGLLMCPERMPAQTQEDRDKLNRFKRLEIGNGKSLDLIVYPSFQGSTLNNAHLFQTPEEITVFHSGDQSSNEIWPWLDHVHEHHAVDVLIVNAWTNDPTRTLKGIRPRVIITCHETEMAHSILHRESYWKSFELFRGKECPPSYTLCWGEKLALPETRRPIVRAASPGDPDRVSPPTA